MKKKVTDIVSGLLNTDKVEEIQTPIQEAKVEDTKTYVAPTYTDSAFGLFKDKQTGEWVVTEIEYDPATLQVKNEIKLIPSGDNVRAVGFERFRITVGRKLMGKE